MHKTKDGQKYIEADKFIPTLTLKEAMQSMNIRQSTYQELRTCDRVNLTNDLPWNPDSVNHQELTHDE